MPYKTDPIGWVPVDKSSDEIDKGVRDRSQHPNDAVAVAFAPSTDESLMKYLETNNPKLFCPPTYAGLVLLGRHHFGELWHKDLIAKLLKEEDNT